MDVDEGIAAGLADIFSPKPEGTEDVNPPAEASEEKGTGVAAEEGEAGVEGTSDEEVGAAGEEAGEEGAEGEASQESADVIAELRQQVERLTDYVRTIKPAVEEAGIKIPPFTHTPVAVVKDDAELDSITTSAEAFNTHINNAMAAAQAKMLEHIWKALPELVTETASRVSENTVQVHNFYRDNPDLKTLGNDYRKKVAKVYIDLEKKNPGASAEELLTKLGPEVRRTYKLKLAAAPAPSRKRGAFAPSGGGGNRPTQASAQPTGLAAELAAMEKI